MLRESAMALDSMRFAPAGHAASRTFSTSPAASPTPRGNRYFRVATREQTRFRHRAARHHLLGAVRHQLLPHVERHDAVAHPVDLSVTQNDVSPVLCTGRIDHAGLPMHRIAVAAGRRTRIRQAADAILAAGRRRVHAGRYRWPWPGAELRDGSSC